MVVRPNPPPRPGTVPILGKANRVFEMVARAPGGITAKSLASSLGIAPATCYRILRTFVADGWLRARPGGAFELSFGLVPLLRPLLRHEVLIEAVREPMGQLARATGITAKLTVRQGDDAVTIFSAQSPRPHAIASRVGAVVSLAFGSSGAAYLGALPEDEINRILDAAPPEAWKNQKRAAVFKRVREGRTHGVYSDSGSYLPSIHTLSAPLCGAGQEVTGVITLLGFPHDFAGTARVGIVQQLKFTAGGCSRLIQGGAFDA